MNRESGTLRIQLLGPVRAWQDERELRIGPPQRRAVLAMLAMRGGRPLAAGEIARGLATGPSARRVSGRVAAHVTGLRGVLDGCGAVSTVLYGPALDGSAPDGPVPAASVLAGRGPGYLLRLDAADLDTGLLDADLASARDWCAAGRLHSAARALDAAVARFQGQPLHAVPGPWAAGERERLADLRLAVLEERVEVMLALGHHREAVPLLTGLVREHPQRERFLGQLMVALYRSGWRAEALACFAEACPVPAGRPARPPGPGLLRLQLQILTGDSALMTMLPPGGALPVAGAVSGSGPHTDGSHADGSHADGSHEAGPQAAGPGGGRGGESGLSREAAAAYRWRRSATPPPVPGAAR